MAEIKELPKEYLEHMRALLGREYDSYLESFGEKWNPSLRVNTLKTDGKRLKDLEAGAGFMERQRILL